MIKYLFRRENINIYLRRRKHPQSASLFLTHGNILRIEIEAQFKTIWLTSKMP
jgi:hypothetical protein